MNSTLSQKNGTLTNVNSKIERNHSWITKSGKIVTLQINCGLQNALSNGDIIFTLPADFKPASNTDVEFFASIEGEIAHLLIGKNTGNVSIRNDFSTRTWLTAVITYIAV